MRASRTLYHSRGTDLIVCNHNGIRGGDGPLTRAFDNVKSILHTLSSLIIRHPKLVRYLLAKSWSTSVHQYLSHASYGGPLSPFRHINIELYNFVSMAATTRIWRAYLAHRAFVQMSRFPRTAVSWWCPKSELVYFRGYPHHKPFSKDSLLG